MIGGVQRFQLPTPATPMPLSSDGNVTPLNEICSAFQLLAIGAQQVYNVPRGKE